MAFIRKPDGTMAGPLLLTEGAVPFLGVYSADYTPLTTDPEGNYLFIIYSPSEGIKDSGSFTATLRPDLSAEIAELNTIASELTASISGINSSVSTLNASIETLSSDISEISTEAAQIAASAVMIENAVVGADGIAAEFTALTANLVSALTPSFIRGAVSDGGTLRGQVADQGTIVGVVQDDQEIE